MGWIQGKGRPINIRRKLVPFLSLAVLALVVPAGAAGSRTSLISKTSGGEVATDGHSYDATVSSGGRFVAFTSYATNLPGANSYAQIYVRDRQNGTTRLVSKNNPGNAGDGNSYNPSVSGGGRYVTFDSSAPNMPGPASDRQVYLRDLQTAETFLVSRTTGDVPASGGTSDESFVSSGGRFVAFNSSAANLPGALDTGPQVYIRDRETGTTQLVSKSNSGAPANANSENPSLGGGVRFVAFMSRATNLPGDLGGANNQVYVRDRVTERTLLVSRTSNEDPANDESNNPSISGGGRYVAFQSYATNLPGSLGPASSQVYLRDRQNGSTKLVSKTADGSPASGGSYGGSSPASVSNNGRWVAFGSYSTNLPGTDGVNSVYLRDMEAAGARLVSKNNSGEPADGTSHISTAVRTITARGEFVVFESYAENLSGSIGPTYRQVYIRGRLN